MSQPFLGEIRLFPYNFSPRGWADCAGQILSIAQNTALFSLLGTTYGGNGQTTFQLPDLRGRVAMSVGQSPGLSNYSLGEISGSENVTLLSTQMPQHNHTLTEANAKAEIIASKDAANVNFPNGNLLGGGQFYANTSTSGKAALDGNTVKFIAGAVTDPTGGSQPHNNLQPFLILRYSIALQGIFPSRN
jgi:microcystin-dependent protein